MDTVVIDLCFVSSQDITMQSENGLEPVAEVKNIRISLGTKHCTLHCIVLAHVLHMLCFPYSRKSSEKGTQKHLILLSLLALGLRSAI
jgi:hypothetical protein